MKVRCFNIQWDIDEDQGEVFLPTVVIVDVDDPNDDEEISDALSDATGFCHKGFESINMPDQCWPEIA